MAVRLQRHSPVILGILGGVGPAAGVYLHQEIIQNTMASGDSDHFQVAHISRSHDITDRTKFLMGTETSNPAQGMLRSLSSLYAASQSLQQRLIVSVPCGTFHSSPIFSVFHAEAMRLYPDIVIVNMIEEVKVHLAERMRLLGRPSFKTVGVMSTTGTRNARVYDTAFEADGYKLLQVPETEQPRLHDGIYNPHWGLKSVAPASDRAKRQFEKYVRQLGSSGAEAVILGCTEIPLALPKHVYRGIPLIDPLTALARGMIRQADPSCVARIRTVNPTELEAGLMADHDSPIDSAHAFWAADDTGDEMEDGRSLKG